MKSFKQHVQLLTEAKETFPVNQGHAYEFVLAAAMVARFTDRFDGGEPKDLTPKSVMKVMEKYYGGYIYWTVSEGDEEADSVEFDGKGLPQEVHDALSQDKIRKHPAVKKMIESAIRAVKNNRTLTKLSLDVITNHKADNIEVRCGGTTGQMKTKSDVDVYVNDRELRKVGFSVKYGGTQQGGQFAGKDAVENLINGFNSFDIDVSRLVSPVTRAMGSIVGVYKSPASADDPVIISDKAIMFPAVLQVFQKVAQKYTSKELMKPKITDALMKGLRKANVGDEKDVEVLRGKSITYDKKTFDGFAEYISDAASQGNAEFKLERDALATLGLYANGKKMFQLRFRYDRDKQRDGSYHVRFRLYVENGRFLDTLAGEI